MEAFTGYLNGEEPYHSFFSGIAARSLAGTSKERTAIRREWLTFMRFHIVDYLTRWPDSRDPLTQYLTNLLTQRHLREDTQHDVEALLTAARQIAQQE